MKRVLFLLGIATLSLSLTAQSRDIKIQQSLDEAKAKLVEFDTERMLDSLDQEALPRIVSGGLLAGANLSNFIITRDHNTMSSYMRIGGEICVSAVSSEDLWISVSSSTLLFSRR